MTVNKVCFKQVYKKCDYYYKKHDRCFPYDYSTYQFFVTTVVVVSLFVQCLQDLRDITCEVIEAKAYLRQNF